MAPWPRACLVFLWRAVSDWIEVQKFLGRRGEDQPPGLLRTVVVSCVHDRGLDSDRVEGLHLDALIVDEHCSLPPEQDIDLLGDVVGVHDTARGWLLPVDDEGHALA